MVKIFFFFFFFFFVGKVVRYNTALAHFRDNPDVATSFIGICIKVPVYHNQKNPITAAAKYKTKISNKKQNQ